MRGGFFFFPSDSYLLNAVGPALPDAVLRPGVVGVLGQLVHHGFLGQGQLDVAQVQGSGPVAARQLVAATDEATRSRSPPRSGGPGGGSREFEKRLTSAAALRF